MIVAPLLGPIQGTMLATVLGDRRNLARSLLLFVTNVVAIIATGIVVMVFYGETKLVGTHARPSVAPSLKKPIVLLVSMLVIVGVPLSLSSARVASTSVRDAAIREEVAEWATETGWWLQSIDQVGDEAVVTLEGALPLPEVDEIGEGLAERGIDPSLVRVVLLPVYEVRLGE